MQNSKVRTSFKDSLKSMDTEETLDIYFYRPIGYAWALLFMRLGITPNPVTVAAIIIGAVGGFLFYYQDLTINIIGMLLIVWANSFDSADGQLARMTNNTSRLGRYLDGLCGNLWFVVIYVTLCIRLTNQGFGLWIWFFAAAAGACHVLQAAMGDYYRNIHLLFLKGKAGSELDNGAQLDIDYKKLTWKDNFFDKMVAMSYKDYTKRQELFSPKLQGFMQLVRERFGDTLPKWLCEEFRTKDKPLMKYTNILTFNTRIIALFISLFLDKVWLYFLFELTVLNILLVYLIVQQENISQYFYKKLKENP